MLNLILMHRLCELLELGQVVRHPLLVLGLIKARPRRLLGVVDGADAIEVGRTKARKILVVIHQ